MSRLKNLAVGYLRIISLKERQSAALIFSDSSIPANLVLLKFIHLHVFNVNGLSSSFVYPGAQLLTSGETC